MAWWWPCPAVADTTRRRGFEAVAPPGRRVEVPDVPDVLDVPDVPDVPEQPEASRDTEQPTTRDAGGRACFFPSGSRCVPAPRGTASQRQGRGRGAVQDLSREHTPQAGARDASAAAPRVPSPARPHDLDLADAPVDCEGKGPVRSALRARRPPAANRLHGPAASVLPQWCRGVGVSACRDVPVPRCRGVADESSVDRMMHAATSPTSGATQGLAMLRCNARRRLPCTRR